MDNEKKEVIEETTSKIKVEFVEIGSDSDSENLKLADNCGNG